ncbi:ATP-grasp superfamily enzyme [Candidatus Mancarchaeum acidiphilum]|uniref:ATP-grasp superfamily enzyme n=1 Tax=Candidatus Mancarchaeum acidiphilum TaxID=1920749 RepID=A0A218NP44_9ARCH|nr:proteasome assembly chaperone family protein [Candidatus Mancarchaeum acidiphilum]ASI14247.1 ATP-grasp superfamily enzyme [Candidatus Mancarchaeum acidiphilum]
MKNTFIKYKKGVKLKSPILIVGLPGIGAVGKLVATQMIKEFKGKRIATLYSSHLPPRVIMLKNGKVRLVSNRFYLLKTKTKNDIVILTGEDQAVTPEGQYTVNNEIVRFFKSELKGKEIITVGGYNISGNYTDSPRVLGNASSDKVIKEFKKAGVVFGESRGTIFGAAGLIVAFSKMQKLDSICIMGESSLIDMDPNAAKAVLKVLSKKFSLNIDMKKIDSMIEATAKMIKELESQMSSNAALPPESKENSSYIR